MMRYLVLIYRLVIPTQIRMLWSVQSREIIRPCTGRRAKLEKEDETNKGNHDRISEVVGSERDLMIHAIVKLTDWLTIIIIQCSYVWWQNGKIDTTTRTPHHAGYKMDGNEGVRLPPKFGRNLQVFFHIAHVMAYKLLYDY